MTIGVTTAGYPPCKGTGLDRLEASVETACQAIYRQHEGYWPSDTERHRIAIALLSTYEFSPYLCGLCGARFDTELQAREHYWLGQPNVGDDERG